MHNAQDVVSRYRRYLNLTTNAVQMLKMDDLAGCEDMLHRRKELAQTIQLSDKQLSSSQREIAVTILKEIMRAQDELQQEMAKKKSDLMDKMQVLNRSKKMASSYHSDEMGEQAVAYDRLG